MKKTHRVWLGSRFFTHYNVASDCDYLIPVVVNNQLYHALKKGGYLLDVDTARIYAETNGFRIIGCYSYYMDHITRIGELMNLVWDPIIRKSDVV